MSSETATEIMSATRRALCEHGYTDLTMQRIAEEASMTSAAIHYHYETKQELLNAFLDDLIERFERKLACEEGDAGERLGTFLDAVFEPSQSGDDDFPVALMELKAQAPYHEGYRERFLELDETMLTVVATTVRDGVESGQFDAADPEEVARFVTTAINGGHVRAVALGEPPEETRAMIESYLTRQLDWRPEGKS